MYVSVLAIGSVSERGLYLDLIGCVQASCDLCLIVRFGTLGIVWTNLLTSDLLSYCLHRPGVLPY